MGVKDLNWYSPFVFLVGAILSFADPITDILTLVEFTVSYKWWIIGVLMFHSCAVVIATVIQNRDEVGCNSSYVLSTILFTGIHCLRDDFVELSIGVQVGGLTMSVYFSHIFLY